MPSPGANVRAKGTYAASKRSLELAAETLRLELAPFGVEVLEIVTGGVKTRGQTYFGDFKLPDQSLYKNIEDVIASRAQGKDGLPRMEAAEYAAAVADQMTSRTTGRFWYGNNAESTKMSTTATAVLQSAMVSSTWVCVFGYNSNQAKDAGMSQGCGLNGLK